MVDKEELGSAVLEIWAVPSNLPFLAALQHWAPLTSSPRDPPHRAALTSLVIMARVLAKFATPLQSSSPDHWRNPKTKPCASAAQVAPLLLPFLLGRARHFGQKSFFIQKMPVHENTSSEKVTSNKFLFPKTFWEKKLKNNIGNILAILFQQL